MKHTLIHLTGFLATIGSAVAANYANYATEVAADAPVTWLRFEGNATDSGTGGNNGTVTTASGTGFGTGFTTNGGDSLGQYFSNNDSTGSYVDLGTGLLGDLSGSSAISIEFWMDVSGITSSNGGAAIFISNSNGSTAAAINVDDVGTGRITVAGRSQDTDGFISRAATNVGFEDSGANKLLHIVGILDYGDTANNPSMQLWVNGQSIALDADAGSDTFGSTTIVATAGSNPTWIGRSQANANEFQSSGMPIDEVAVYDLALSGTRILAHYNAVPEPSSFALLGGLMALTSVVVRRRRRL